MPTLTCYKGYQLQYNVKMLDVGPTIGLLDVGRTTRACAHHALITNAHVRYNVMLKTLHKLLENFIIFFMNQLIQQLRIAGFMHYNLMLEAVFWDVLADFIHTHRYFFFIVHACMHGNQSQKMLHMF